MKLLPIALVLATAPLAWPQAGHWDGAIQTPGPALTIAVDLTKNDKGAWTGAINIPDQHIQGYPLSNIAVEGKSVKFAMAGVPGEPAFDGKLSEDGKTLEGGFTQGGANLTFKVTRTGEPVFAKSSAISKELEGSWEGTLDANGTKLRLILKLANKDGSAAGTWVSVDQGGAEIPCATVVQKGSTLDVQAPTIGASFTGQVNKDNSEISGEFAQGMGKFPLTLKRAAK
jgi:hypothetical protein